MSDNQFFLSWSLKTTKCDFLALMVSVNGSPGGSFASPIQLLKSPAQ